MGSKGKEEELALFLEMKSRHKDTLSLSSLGRGKNDGRQEIGKTVSSVTTHRKTAADKFLDSENHKSDYDWLITPPGTPLQLEAPKPVINQTMCKARPVALKSRLTNVQQVPIAKGSVPSKCTSFPSRPNSATPTTGRPTLPVTTKAPRSSTPTWRPSKIPAAAAPVRSSTPTRTTAPRSSTPTSRSSDPMYKSSSRSATPTRQRSDPIKLPNGRSASVSKAAPTLSKNVALSGCTSPTTKSRPWKPIEMPGFSLDAPPNLRTSLPERPASATRARPRSSNNTRPRQQSCSPAKGRASTGNALGSKICLSNRSKGQMKSSDDVNPVLMGTKIVERIVNMRKLVPPKHDDHHPTLSNSNAKSSSLDGSGFGCSLSKKSLDMALRHMDIRRTVNGSLRPVLTSIPASSMYSVRSGGSTKGRTTGSSDSPLGTRSNASSEPSVHNSPFFADGLELTDSFGGIERGNSSPVSQNSKRCE